MCGRFTLRLSTSELQEFFDLVRACDAVPRYNIAPTHSIAAIRRTSEGRVADPMHWGLIPRWAKDRKLAARMINARSETLSEKPSFRTAFKRSRCLIPADGFYEWKPTAGKTKQPYHITLADESPFAFAGLWDRWTDPESAQPLESCTIVTTGANELLRDLHERMPVILPREHWEVWLDPEMQETDALQPLLTAYPSNEMQMKAVSTLVNSPRNDAPDCLLPESGRTLH